MKLIGDLCMEAMTAIYGRVRNYPYWTKNKEDGNLFLQSAPCQCKPMKAGSFYTDGKFPVNIGADTDGWQITYENRAPEWRENSFFNSYFSPMTYSFK